MRKRRAELLILAMDIGSSSTRAALFDDKARRLAHTAAAIPYSLRYTSGGGAELSPFVLQRALERCRAEVLRRQAGSSSLRHTPIAAIAASSMWHALLGLNKTGRPVTPIFTWADSRAMHDAARLRQKLREKEIHARTGCMVRATFWPAKILWLKRTQRRLYRQVARWCSPVDWVFGELFGSATSSQSMVSATGLYDFRRQQWDQQFCEQCGLDPSRLPRIAEESEPKDGSRLFNAIGDGAAGNLGSGADRPGILALNAGTSAAARIIYPASGAAERKVPFGLFRYAVDADRALMGGAISNAGNLRVWCLRNLRVRKAQADRVLSRAKATTDSLTVLPFWVSERAPTWPEGQFGVIDRLDQTTQAADILRATTTAVFYRLAQIIELIEAATAPPRRIIVSGGLVHSIPALKLLADAIERDIEIAREPEASLRGAAVYALGKMRIKVPSPATGRIIKHERVLAARHRERRQRQIELEKILTSRVSRETFGPRKE